MSVAMRFRSLGFAAMDMPVVGAAPCCHKLSCFNVELADGVHLVRRRPDQKVVVRGCS